MPGCTCKAHHHQRERERERERERACAKKGTWGSIYLPLVGLIALALILGRAFDDAVRVARQHAQDPLRIFGPGTSLREALWVGAYLVGSLDLLVWNAREAVGQAVDDNKVDVELLLVVETLRGQGDVGVVEAKHFGALGLLVCTGNEGRAFLDPKVGGDAGSVLAFAYYYDGG